MNSDVFFFLLLYFDRRRVSLIEEETVDELKQYVRDCRTIVKNKCLLISRRSKMNQ
jgi:hypothetical protein